MKIKICTGCGEEKPLNTDFYGKCNQSKDGFKGKCKKCRKEEHRIKVGKPLIKVKKGYRQCSSCKEEKLLNENNFWKRTSDGSSYHKQCKVCQSQKKSLHYKNNDEHYKVLAKKNYHDNREKIIPKMKKRYLENSEERLSKAKFYYNKNKDRIKKVNADYYARNKDIICKRNKVYRINNKEKINNYIRNNRDKNVIKCQRRIARIKELPYTLTLEQWEGILIKFNNRCAYCGSEKKLQQEHFIPLSKGGEYTHNNIIPACKSCNCKKSNADFFNWYPQYEYYDKKREKFILDYLGYDNKIQKLSIL